MLRVTQARKPDGRPVLVVEGRLAGPTLVDLSEAAAPFLENPASLTLDVTGVVFADKPGVALLLDLRSRKVALEGISPFLSALLNEEPA